MLHNIPPILSPDLLASLRAMGHGDDIVIADANFPATSLGKRCHRLDGISATDALTAILTVLPLDTFVPDPAITMQVVDEPDTIPPVVTAFQSIVTQVADHPVTICAIDRFAFYARAQAAFAIVQTGETRFYGNIILKKGVIGG